MTPQQCLKAWVNGKTPLFWFLAFPAAFSAELIHSLIGTREGERVQRDTADRTDQAWERYYNSLYDWVMELPLARFPSPIPLSREVLGKLIAGDTSSAEAQQLRQLQEPFDGLASSVVEGLIEELTESWGSGGPAVFTADEYDQLRALPAVSFLVRVFVPCVMRHQSTPQQLYKTATAPSGRNIDAIAKLAEIDPEVIHLPAAREVLHAGGPTGVGANFEIVYPGMQRVHHAPDRSTTKRWIASCLYHIAKQTGEPLTATQVRELFDIAANSRDPDVLVDSDFGAVQSESFARMLRRYGKDWEWLLADI